MNKNYIVIIVIVLLLAAIGAFAYYKTSQMAVVVEDDTSGELSAVVQDSVVGCYLATLGKDVYTLDIQAQNDDVVSGKLSFKNFEKDSSSGSFNGSYRDGILFGDYAFTSEGMNSVLQVIFKKSGNSFIRGYGPMNATGDRFADINNITFDPNQTFVLSSNCAL